MDHKYEKIIFVVCLVISLGFLFLAGVTIWTSVFVSLFFVLLSLMVLLVSEGLLYESAKGKVKDDCGDFGLIVNEVYETLSAVKVIVDANASNDFYVAILRNREDRLLAYRFKQIPPKCFKKTDDKENPYAAYPSVSVESEKPRDGGYSIH